MKRTIVLALGALVVAYGLAIVSLNGANAQTAHPGPTTEQAKADTGIDVQRLEVELAAFVWRSYPHFTVNARCPGGYICTLHEGDNVVRVYTGDNVVRNIFAGTFRHVSSYPSSDAVHRPCELLAKEQAFGAQEVPSFPVTAGNFSCGAGAPAPGPSTGDPSADLGGSWSFVGGNQWRLVGGSQRICGHPSWIVHTPGFPGDPGLPAGSCETTDVATAYRK